MKWRVPMLGRAQSWTWYSSSKCPFSLLVNACFERIVLVHYLYLIAMKYFSIKISHRLIQRLTYLIRHYTGRVGETSPRPKTIWSTVSSSQAKAASWNTVFQEWEQKGEKQKLTESCLVLWVPDSNLLKSHIIIFYSTQQSIY